MVLQCHFYTSAHQIYLHFGIKAKEFNVHEDLPSFLQTSETIFYSLFELVLYNYLFHFSFELIQKGNIRQTSDVCGKITNFFRKKKIGIRIQQFSWEINVVVDILSKKVEPETARAFEVQVDTLFGHIEGVI